MRTILLPILAIFGLASPAWAKRLIGTSGPGRVHLVELFTSESCSSCPPADQWLSALQSDKGLFKSFVPIAFHVDYWNDSGWEDKFSSNAMTKRQVALANRWIEPAVYTPGVIADGLEWKEWRKGQLPKAGGPSEAEISLFQDGTQDFTVEIKFKNKLRKNYAVYFALLGLGIESQVTGGENSGRQLKHNFVVLQWEKVPVTDAHSAHAKLANLKPKYSKLVAVAWLEEDGNPTPLQAVGGFL
jgi:hypothetical protein